MALALVWVAPERDDPSHSHSDSIRRTGNGHPAPSTVLAVEDEVLIRLAVSDYLRECGYRVLEAGTGEEAQTILSSGELIDVMLSDIDLGAGINGFELAKWVRANHPAVRIILSSGATRMAREAESLCDGPFLQKPFSFSALNDHIKRLLALGMKHS